MRHFLILLLAAVFATLGLILVIGVSVLINAALAMLVCNWALPMFDIHYPITFYQGCGIGVVIMAVREALGRTVNVGRDREGHQ